MPISVLIVDDDRDFTRVLQMDLELAGYEVSIAGDGLAGLEVFKAHSPSLVMLDVSLPIMDGYAVCRKIREISDVPILMMTATPVDESQIAEGLNIGADEFMLKPLPVIEFHARVRALLRRARVESPQPEPITHYEDDYLMVDIPTRRVRINGTEIRLTPTEFKLIAMFVQHPGEVLSFQRLLESVWGPEYKTENHYPRIYVSHLRRKIEPDLKFPTYVHNEYGIGYRFVGKISTRQS